MDKYQESEEMYLETILLLKQKDANVHAINIAVKEQGGKELAREYFLGNSV